MILVTGSAGLIGRAICARLRAHGHPVRSFDQREDAGQDVRDSAALGAALVGVRGIIHLAAVSRIAVAEQDPDLTQATNVVPLVQIAAYIRAATHAPWLIFASSREVYGHCGTGMVKETQPLAPINVYGRSKCDGEAVVTELNRLGHVANICRFSNVYGDVNDHADRVVPAFARAAATGGTLRIDGGRSAFDFTHIDDVSDGLMRAITATQASTSLPPIHFVSGRATTLATLAHWATRQTAHGLAITEAPPRAFDVSHFRGDPSRAASLLGWAAAIPIEQGFARLIDQFRNAETARLSP